MLPQNISSVPKRELYVFHETAKPTGKTIHPNITAEMQTAIKPSPFEYQQIYAIKIEATDIENQINA